MFVLISLVTQGAFESVGERTFERRERGRGEGQLSFGPDAVLETGGCGLGGVWTWRVTARTEIGDLFDCMCVYRVDCFVPKQYHYRNKQCHLYMLNMRFPNLTNPPLNVSDFKYTSSTVVEAQE